jgi:hypothetical protein
MGGDQVGGRDPIPPTKRAYSQNTIINVHYIYLFWSASKQNRSMDGDKPVNQSLGGSG